MTATITWEERQRRIRELDEAPTPPTLSDFGDEPTLVPGGEEAQEPSITDGGGPKP